MFQLIGRIVIETQDDIEECIIDSGAGDYEIEEGRYVITTSLASMTETKAYLENK